MCREARHPLAGTVVYLTREHAWKQLLERRHRRIPPHEKPHRSAMWAELEAALQRRLKQAQGEEPWVALDHVLANYRPSRFSSVKTTP